MLYNPEEAPPLLTCREEEKVFMLIFIAIRTKNEGRRVKYKDLTKG